MESFLFHYIKAFSDGLRVHTLEKALKNIIYMSNLGKSSRQKKSNGVPCSQNRFDPPFDLDNSDH